MDCGVDSAGDSSVQAFEEDSEVDSMVGLENVDFSNGFQLILRSESNMLIFRSLFNDF